MWSLSKTVTSQDEIKSIVETDLCEYSKLVAEITRELSDQLNLADRTNPIDCE